jgi:hypothetical protein
MEPDFFEYLGIKNNSGMKKSASSRVESLILRGSASSAKINSMKIKQKAKELKEMRSIPIINQKSRKIAEGLKRERLDILNQPPPKNDRIPTPEPVRISINILNSLEKVEQTPPEPDLKSMNVVERSQYWKQQKEKKIEEQRKAKQDRELDGCTFKPKKTLENYEDVLNRPQTVKISNDVPEKPPDARPKSYKNVPEKSKKLSSDNLGLLLKGKDAEKHEITIKTSNDGLPNNIYKNLSPAKQDVRIKPGFLSDLLKPKGK